MISVVHKKEKWISIFNLLHNNWTSRCLQNIKYLPFKIMIIDRVANYNIHHCCKIVLR